MIKRKPRAGPLQKYYRHVKRFVVVYGPILVRYGVMPGMLMYSLYRTEPQPTLWELLNPFTR